VKYTPKTEKGKAKLDKIIESAIDLIYEKGFNNTSIGDITRNANVSYGSFYFYFNNKDDLLVELVRKLNRDLRHYLTESIKGLKDRVSIEKRGFEAFFEWMQKNKKLYKILIEAEANNLQVYAWHYRKIAERYSQKLKEAMEKGEITAYDSRDPVLHLNGDSRLHSQEIHTVGWKRGAAHSDKGRGEDLRKDAEC